MASYEAVNEAVRSMSVKIWQISSYFIIHECQHQLSLERPTYNMLGAPL